jgi:excisionase family DNA binding protein
MASSQTSDRVERTDEYPDDYRMMMGPAAEFLGVSRRTLQTLQMSGVIRHFKIGGRIQFAVGDLRAYVASCERPAVNP